MSKKHYIVINRNERRSECKCRLTVLRKPDSALHVWNKDRALCGSIEGVTL